MNKFNVVNMNTEEFNIGFAVVICIVILCCFGWLIKLACGRCIDGREYDIDDISDIDSPIQELRYPEYTYLNN